MLFVLLYQNRRVAELRFLTAVEEAIPGRFVTLVFALRNPAAEERDYRLVLDWPEAEGWKLIGPPPERVPLEPKAEQRIFITLGVPPRAEAGTYTIRLWAEDGGEHIAEAEVRVAAVAVPRVEPRSPRAEAEAGHGVELIYKVRNVGNVADAFAIEVVAPEGWEARASAAAVSVEPGETATVVVQLEIPEDAPVRVYQIALEARAGRHRARGVVKLTVLPR